MMENRTSDVFPRQHCVRISPISNGPVFVRDGIRPVRFGIYVMDKKKRFRRPLPDMPVLPGDIAFPY